uniref:VWFA domain-containing protein n=1 Tax=Angiostrongylus cantonensis TaxID=6313 RepID=A0A0K0D712_ANGCA
LNCFCCFRFIRGVEVKNGERIVPTCRYDIVLVFDASGSVKERFRDELEVANRLIDKLVIGPNHSQIAAIKYAGRGKSRVILDFNYITDKKEIKKRIARTKFLSGTTCTNEALLKAASVLSRTGARPSKAKPIVIVFTDGYSTVDPTKGQILI